MSPTISNNLSTVPPQKVDIVIFSAMMEELEIYQHLFTESQSESVKAAGFDFLMYHYLGKKILLVPTGFGTTFAASVATFVCHNFFPDFIFLSGTAGAIHSKLNLCDVIIAEKAFEAEVQDVLAQLKGTPFESCLTHPLKNSLFPAIYSADPELLTIAQEATSDIEGVYVASVVTSNTFPAPKELFAKIKAQDPYSIDMETSALYQVAWLFGIPALATRGISNILDTDGSDENIHESDVAGSARRSAEILVKIIDSLLLKLEAKNLICESDLCVD